MKPRRIEFSQKTRMFLQKEQHLERIKSTVQLEKGISVKGENLIQEPPPRFQNCMYPISIHNKKCCKI